MSKNITLILIIIMITLTGCTNEDEINELKQKNETEIQQVNKEFDEKIIEIKTKNEEELLVLENEVKDLMKKNSELEETISKIDEESSIDTQLDQSIVLEKDKNIFILDGIYNQQNTEADFKTDVEKINGIGLGSNMSVILEELGYEYELSYSDDGFDPRMIFDGMYISVFKDSSYVSDIFVNKEGHKTNEGIQVGDNALKVISLYKDLYQMNENGNLHPEYSELLFKLEGDFYIEFSIDTEKLDESSKIKTIKLYNIYYGEY